MLRPYGEDYKQTRLIKKGKIKLEEKFREFANWVNETFAVEILNVYVDVLDGGSTRVQLIFEHQSDVKKFELKDRFSFSYYKRKKIIKKYSQLFEEEKPQGIFVLFYAFEPLAKEAANTKISLKKIETLKVKYQKVLWEIMRYNDQVIFFFHDNKNLKKAKTSGFTEKLKNEYYAILKPLDEFNYFTLSNLNAIFDSKQNFDEKYNSSWRCYFD